MVESLLQHEITSVNVREALKISRELKLDSVTGLLLEHISVDRSRESVNLSGLDLSTLKPLWILPSLGVKTVLEAKPHRRHRKQRSLGHVKDVIIRRKSVATIDSNVDLESADNKRDSRKLSVDFSALKYVSDMDGASEAEEIDFGVAKSGEDLDRSSKGPQSMVSGHSRVVVSSIPEVPCEWGGKMVSHASDDSGVGTVRNTYQTMRYRSITSESPAINQLNPGVVVHKIMPQNSLLRPSHGTVSGATTLPHSKLDQYTFNQRPQHPQDERSGSNRGNTSAFNVTLSPSQLFKKIRRHRKSEEKHGSLASRADSPIPVIYSVYPRDDVPWGLQGSFSLDHVAPNHNLAESSFATASTDSSPSSRLACDSAGTDGTIADTSAGAELDQVDFAVCAPIPEEPPAKEERNCDLIKLLDLSSNKLTDFKAFDHSEYGDLVYKRLRDITSLDLKQNHINELPSEMMKVCM